MKRLTPAALQALTSGRKASKLIDLPRSGSRSNGGSFEMQARWMTASQPSRLAYVAAFAEVALHFPQARVAPQIREQSSP